MPSKQNPLEFWVSQTALLEISAVYFFCVSADFYLVLLMRLNAWKYTYSVFLNYSNGSVSYSDVEYPFQLLIPSLWQ